MHIIHHIDEWQSIRNTLHSDKTIGFVPTLGALHRGHASLIEKSTHENDMTIVSIYLNPTQFNVASDLENYPDTLEADLEYLKTLGVDFCLLPTTEAIYPDQFTFHIDEEKLSTCLEGAHRPGHFRGVLTVVMKLLNLVRPHVAYFGEKDYQQYELIRDMARAFFINVEIKACPTIRESSGLALSSRNLRLNQKERRLADQFAAIFHQQGPISTIKNSLSELGIDVEYIEDYRTRRFAAVNIGGIRLIDNYAL